MAVYAHEVLAVDAVTAVGLTRTRLGTDPLRRVVLTVETVSIRLRYDGGLPTPTTGHLISAGSLFTLEGADAIRQLRLIATAGTAGVTATGEAP